MNDIAMKIAKSLQADLISGEQPQVYVTTKQRGQNGGEWVDLTYYSSTDDIIETYQDDWKTIDTDGQEILPEIIFTKSQNVPDKYFQNNQLDDDIFEYIDYCERYDKELVDTIIDEYGFQLSSLDDILIFNNCSNMAEVAEQYIDETGGLSELDKETLQNYFDYEAYGKDMEIEGTFIPYKDGYIEILR